MVFASGLNWIVDLIPFHYEEALAAKLPDFPGAACKSSHEANAALEIIVQRLHDPRDDTRGPIHFHLHLIEDAQVNAFAFIGGHIYVNSGLLKEAKSAEELAGVLAHEMSHVSHRDVAHAVAGQLISAALLSQIGDSTALTKLFTHMSGLQFSKKQEDAADHGALTRLAINHIDTKPLGEFFKRLDSGHGMAAFLSDHPDSDKRAELAARAPVQNPSPVLKENEWKSLKAACR